MASPERKILTLSTTAIRVRTNSRAVASRTPLLSREALFCIAIVGLATLLIWPVAQVGIQDDPIYTFTALDFARTGHFIFHGWASPMLGWQAIWGAIFSKLFGATITAVRLSMVPVTLLTVLLYHGSLRRFGLNPAHATFGTLVFALGPLFLPLSVSFMTDVPGIFAVVVCLYCCQLAIDAASDSRAIFFLVMAALSNVVLGTARQIAWLGLLVMVPSCIWLLRRRRYVLQIGVALWLTCVFCVHLMTGWFARQPYTAPERLIPAPFNTHIAVVAAQFISAGLTTMLFLLPVLTLGLPFLWRPRRPTVVRLAAVFVPILALIGLIHRVGEAHIVTFPWLGVTFGLHGILQDGLFEASPPMPSSLQVMLFLIFVISAIGSMEMFIENRQRTAKSASQMQRLEWREICILLIPFLIANWLFLIPRAVFFRLFDRYLLEIVPLLLILALRWHQDHVGERIPFVAKATVAIVGVLTLADTHDLFSALRAQVRLIRELETAGTARSEIRGGLAFDLATQVSSWGYINDPRILNPPNAYKPQPQVEGVPCSFALQYLFPAINGHYEISARPSPCSTDTSFAPQTYRVWLPPRTRQLFIRRIIQPRDAPLAKQ